MSQVMTAAELLARPLRHTFNLELLCSRCREPIAQRWNFNVVDDAHYGRFACCGFEFTLRLGFTILGEIARGADVRRVLFERRWWLFEDGLFTFDGWYDEGYSRLNELTCMAIEQQPEVAPSSDLR